MSKALVGDPVCGFLFVMLEQGDWTAVGGA